MFTLKTYKGITCEPKEQQLRFLGALSAKFITILLIQPSRGDCNGRGDHGCHGVQKVKKPGSIYVYSFAVSKVCGILIQSDFERSTAMQNACLWSTWNVLN